MELVGIADSPQGSRRLRLDTARRLDVRRSDYPTGRRPRMRNHQALP